MIIRKTRKKDGMAMYKIAKETPLDTNSEYSYLMMAKVHSSTCVVAEIEEEVVGFCTANIVCDPKTMFPDTLFIWQIAALKSHRGKGISKKMIEYLVNEIRLPYVECTIAPHNEGSFALFESIAKCYKTEFRVKEGFTEDDFSGDQSPEKSILIGPIAKENMK